MRELDTLLLNYLEHHYPMAPTEERQAFAALLELPDPELWACLAGRIEPNEPARAELIKRIVAS